MHGHTRQEHITEVLVFVWIKFFCIFNILLKFLFVLILIHILHFWGKFTVSNKECNHRDTCLAAIIINTVKYQLHPQTHLGSTQWQQDPANLSVASSQLTQSHKSAPRFSPSFSLYFLISLHIIQNIQELLTTARLFPICFQERLPYAKLFC